jgi:hypothetical protein
MLRSHSIVHASLEGAPTTPGWEGRLRSLAQAHVLNRARLCAKVQPSTGERMLLAGERPLQSQCTLSAQHLVILPIKGGDCATFRERSSAQHLVILPIKGRSLPPFSANKRSEWASFTGLWWTALTRWNGPAACGLFAPIPCGIPFHSNVHANDQQSSASSRSASANTRPTWSRFCTTDLRRP